MSTKDEPVRPERKLKDRFDFVIFPDGDIEFDFLTEDSLAIARAAGEVKIVTRLCG